MSVLTLRNVAKTFPGQRALKSLDLDLAAGSVTGLVGQNGSGKSTLVKILAGYHRPDPGSEATLAGSPFTLGDPVEAHAVGLRFVHQDLGLVDDLSVVDNLALGRGYARRRLGAIAWQAEVESAEQSLRALGCDFDPMTPVKQLRASERTGIAIARALHGWADEAKVLVLDEPTASMPAAEVDDLYDVIETVKAKGLGVLFVSHHFNEVFAVTDRVAVLRDGYLVGDWPTAELDEPELIRRTIGRDLDVTVDARAVADVGERPPVAALASIGGATLRSLDLEVGVGEIVGVAGLTGSGREELLPLLLGAAPRRGTLVVDERLVPPGRPDLAVRYGLGAVHADRRRNALLTERSVRENLLISRLQPSFGRFGYRRSEEQREVDEWLERLDVRPRDGDAAIEALSGGNQQKVVIGRTLRLDPRLLLLDEPTQGVDVGAKAAIHDLVRGVAAQGAGVIVASSESEELVALCDRIVVLRGGEVSDVVAADTVDADGLTELTLGLGAAVPAGAGA